MLIADRMQLCEYMEGLDLGFRRCHFKGKEGCGYEFRKKYFRRYYGGRGRQGGK